MSIGIGMCGDPRPTWKIPSVCGVTDQTSASALTVDGVPAQEVQSLQERLLSKIIQIHVPRVGLILLAQHSQPGYLIG